MKRLIVAFLFILLINIGLVCANEKGWTHIRNNAYKKAIIYLDPIEGKTMDECYLLGLAYLKEGNREKAFEYWDYIIKIKSGDTSPVNKKWEFLFDPEKELVSEQNSKYITEFQTKYIEITLAEINKISSDGLLTAKQKKENFRRLARLEKAKTEIMVMVKEEAEKKKNTIEEIKTENGNSKISIKRSEREQQVIRIVKLIFLIVIGFISLAMLIYVIIYFMYLKPKQKYKEDQGLFDITENSVKKDEPSQSVEVTSTDDNKEDEEKNSIKTKKKVLKYKSNKIIKVKQFAVDHDNNHFLEGYFWFNGELWSPAAFHAYYDYYYTNAMYLENYGMHHKGDYDPEGEAYVMELESELNDTIKEIAVESEVVCEAIENNGTEKEVNEVADEAVKEVLTTKIMKKIENEEDTLEKTEIDAVEELPEKEVPEEIKVAKEQNENSIEEIDTPVTELTDNTDSNSKEGVEEVNVRLAKNTFPDESTSITHNNSDGQECDNNQSNKDNTNSTFGDTVSKPDSGPSKTYSPSNSPISEISDAVSGVNSSSGSDNSWDA